MPGSASPSRAEFGHQIWLKLSDPEHQILVKIPNLFWVFSGCFAAVEFTILAITTRYEIGTLPAITLASAARMVRIAKFREQDHVTPFRKRPAPRFLVRRRIRFHRRDVQRSGFRWPGRLTGSHTQISERLTMTRSIAIGVASFATTALLIFGQYAAIGAI
jgi:hypothetical protein